MFAKIKKVIFTNKQNIPWNDVEKYLKQYVGKIFVVKEAGVLYIYFGMPVQGSQENEERVNNYKVTVVVRIKGENLYLYDIVDIKKEASTPH